MGLRKGWACIGVELKYSLIPLKNKTKTSPSEAQSVPREARVGGVGLGRGWACIGVE